MQTFLPFPSFSASAAALDNRRLNKQIVECKQILLANLCGPRQYWNGLSWQSAGDLDYPVTRKTPWYNHPATKMWRGSEWSLCWYAIACCNEALERGIKVTLSNFFREQQGKLSCHKLPLILGHEPFHASHRSNLKRKDPIHYAAFTEPTILPYIWTLSPETK